MWKPHDASKMGALPAVRVGDSKCGRSRVSATESRRPTLKSQKPQTKSPKMWWTTIWPSSCIFFTQIPRRMGYRTSFELRMSRKPINLKYYRRGQNSSSMVPRTLQIEIKIRQRTHKAILPDRQTQPNSRLLLPQPHPRRALPRLQTRANTQKSKQRSSNNRSSQPWTTWERQIGSPHDDDNFFEHSLNLRHRVWGLIIDKYALN